MPNARSSRRVLRTVLAATAILLALVGCADDESDSAASAAGDGAAGGVESLVLVTPENAGDDGPTDNLIAGMEHAAEEYGLDARHLAATDPSAHEATLRSLAQGGTDVVVAAFSQFTEPVQAVAPDFPDTIFIHLYADEYETPLDNVQTVAYDTQGPSYLAGVVAATLSETGVVGFIGGTAVPQLNADFHAFDAGVQATDGSVRVESAFVGAWNDPVAGQQVAQVMFDNGVDVVLAYAGGSSLGVVKVADETGALVVYDNAESEETRQSVFALASQHYGESLFQQVGTVVDGSFAAGHVRLGLGEGVTFLSPTEGFPEVNGVERVAAVDAAFAAADQVKAGIIDGAVQVPFNTDAI